MRTWYEFTMWNHIFIIYELFYALYLEQYFFFQLGLCSIYLSLQRHRHSEAVYNEIEPFVTRLTIFYSSMMSLYYYNLYQNIVLCSTRLISLGLLYVQDYNYEYIHPWVHIVVALDTHLYLDYSRTI